MKNLKIVIASVALFAFAGSVYAAPATGIDYGAIANSIDFSKVLAAMGVIITASFGLMVALKGVSFLIAALRK